MDWHRLPPLSWYFEYREIKKSIAQLKERSRRPPLGYTYVHSGVQIPQIPVHMQEIYLVCKFSSVMATVTINLKNEIFRRGLVWRPRFAVKCQSCGYEMNKEEDKCTKCGSFLLTHPDVKQMEILDRMVDRCNENGQSLIEVCKQVEYDLDIIDDGYLLLIKEYITDDAGKIDYYKVKEIIRGDPVIMRIVADNQGTLGKTYWTCLEHRDVLVQKPDLKCTHPGCGKPLHEVYYVATMGSTDMQPTEKYVDGEVIHFSKYSPSILYGFSPVIHVWREVSILLHMLHYVNDYYQYMRSPRGAILVYTNNVQQTYSFWDKVQADVESHPATVPIIPVQQLPDGGTQGKTDYVKFMDSLDEMQYIQAKDDLRQRITAIWGVSNVLQNDPAGVGGLNNEGLQIKVTDRAVEAGQKVWNEKVFPSLCKEFGITDYVLQLRPNEEEDEMEKLQIDQQKVQLATAMHSMGFTVELDEDGKPTKFSGEAQQQQQPGLGGMMGGASDFAGGQQPQMPQDFQRAALPAAHAGGVATREAPVLVNKGEVIVPLQDLAFSFKEKGSIHCHYCGKTIRGNAYAEEYDPVTGDMAYTCQSCGKIFERAKSDVEKAGSKVYLKPGEKPPPGVTVQQGPKGGKYYDSKGKLNLTMEQYEQEMLPKKEPAQTEEEIFHKLTKEYPTMNEGAADKISRWAAGEYGKNLGASELISMLGMDYGFSKLKSEQVLATAKAIADGTEKPKDDFEAVFGDKSQYDEKVPGAKERVQADWKANQEFDRKSLEMFSREDKDPKNYKANAKKYLDMVWENPVSHIKEQSELNKEPEYFKPREQSFYDELRQHRHIRDNFFREATKYGEKTSLQEEQFLDNWSGTSESNKASLVKVVMAKMDGRHPTNHEKDNAESAGLGDPKVEAAVEDYIQAEKAWTREMLDRLYPGQEAIPLYRGIRMPHLDPWRFLMIDPWEKAVLRAAYTGEPFEIDMDSLSSWTTNAETADNFSNQIVFKMDVPKDDIFTAMPVNPAFNYEHEHEYVVHNKEYTKKMSMDNVAIRSVEGKDIWGKDKDPKKVLVSRVWECAQHVLSGTKGNTETDIDTQKVVLKHLTDMGFTKEDITDMFERQGLVVP